MSVDALDVGFIIVLRNCLVYGVFFFDELLHVVVPVVRGVTSSAMVVRSVVKATNCL